MEVHHHSHSSRKNWTHYFWEFLMLFLAVTLGFFVENQREHFIEHQREKVYIRSLWEDLKKDTAGIQQSAVIRKNVCAMIDTLIMILKNDSRNKLTGKIYYLARKIPYSDGRFSFNTKTFDQLKSSGNLRLIRNMKILDMISDYYFDAGNAAVRGPLDMNFENRHDLYLSTYKLFDASIFHKMMDVENPLVFYEPAGKPPLFTDDPVVINEICSRYHYIYGTHRVIMMDNERLKNKAIQLMQLLQGEYRLE
jgi:hypothetical protein